MRFSFDLFPKLSRLGPMYSDLVDEGLPEWDTWVQRVYNTMKSSFKPDSAPFILISKGVSDGKALNGNGEDVFVRAKTNLLKGLELAIKALEKDTHGELLGQSASPSRTVDSKKIFIVHGHDHEAKNELEIFLSEIGLEPIVLHRKADEGLTLLEKFEKYSDVGYAIVLLTPDDVVASSDEDRTTQKTEHRARQNVIFEFGFFVGRLGRNRVCCLHQDNVTLPSDVSGLIYKPFRSHIEEVKYPIIRELKAAGYQISI